MRFKNHIDEREDLRSVPDVDIAKLVQRVERKKNKNLSEIDLCPDTFKKIDEDGIYNPGKWYENNIIVLYIHCINFRRKTYIPWNG